MLQNKKLRLFILMIIVLSISMIFLFSNKQAPSKEKIAAGVVTELENYKATHQRYPRFIQEINMTDIDWIGYLPDSMRSSYLLTFPKGMIKKSTVIYDSKTKKWVERFGNGVSR